MANIDPTVRLMYYMFLKHIVPGTDYQAVNEKVDIMCRWVDNPPSLQVGRMTLAKATLKKLKDKATRPWINIV